MIEGGYDNCGLPSYGLSYDSHTKSISDFDMWAIGNAVFPKGSGIAEKNIKIDLDLMRDKISMNRRGLEHLP